MGFVTPIGLLLLQAPLFTTAHILLAKKSIPEPYGHTANIAPHAPNTDREWYTEYRWKKGQEYKPQDGVITEKPKFAPVPKPTPAPKKKFLRKPLNKKPVRKEEPEKKPKQTKEVEEKHAKLPKMKPEKAEPEAVEAAKVKEEIPKEPKKTKKEPVKEVDVDSKKAVTPPGVGAPVKKPPEPKYAVPKPCGHTSQVHPYNWNNDREWYTEYRWKKGSEYKIQDGPITEKPVAANKVIQTFPVEQDCDPSK